MAKKAKSNLLKIYSWNVNGIRAIQKKGFMEWVNNCKGDIICLQETKAHPEQLDDSIKQINDYKSYWFSAEKKGYSSVAIYSKPDVLKIRNGLNNKIFDSEGRVIIAEYEKFVLANVYFPTAGAVRKELNINWISMTNFFLILKKNTVRVKASLSLAIIIPLTKKLTLRVRKKISRHPDSCLKKENGLIKL